MRSQLLIMIGLVALLFPLRSFADQSLNRLYEEALSAYRIQDRAGSSLLLKNILKQDPENSEANLLYGSILAQEKKWEKARLYFSRADTDDLNSETAFAYGQTYFNSKNYKKAALGFAENLRIKGPNRNESRFFLGCSYFKLGYLRRARKHLERVKVETLSAAQQKQRSRYLQLIAKQETMLVKAITLPGFSDAFEPSAQAISDEDFDEVGTKIFSLYPSFALLQLNEQTDNHGLSSVNSDVLLHRVLIRAVSASNRMGSAEGKLDFIVGTAGYKAEIDNSQLVAINQIEGEFNSKVGSSRTESWGLFACEPKLSFTLLQSMDAEISFSHVSHMPKWKYDAAWGQNAGQLAFLFNSDSAQVKLGAAFQSPYDNELTMKANDSLLFTDGRLVWGDVSLLIKGSYWETDAPEFKTRERLHQVLDTATSRYRIGFKSEAEYKVGLSYSWNDIDVILAYQSIERKASQGAKIPRLDPLDGIDLSSAAVQNLSFEGNMVLWEGLTLNGAYSSSNLSSYYFPLIDDSGNFLVEDFFVDAQQSKLRFSGIIEFSDWLRFQASYAQKKISYQGEEVDSKDFIRNNPSIQVESTIGIEIEKKF